MDQLGCREQGFHRCLSQQEHTLPLVLATKDMIPGL